MIIFINPYTHHSYFSVLALSKLGKIEILCPPLSLQILLSTWRKDKLKQSRSLRGALVLQPAALILYLAFKKCLLSEAAYSRLFKVLAFLLIYKRRDAVIYCYQDYMLPVMQLSSSWGTWICEFIIQAPSDQPNHASSLEAARLAAQVIVPTSRLSQELLPQGVSTCLAPYGGNKAQFLATPVSYRKKAERKHKENTDSLIVIARANSFRKGFDLLVEALELLDQRWPSHIQTELQITICGSLEEGHSQEKLAQAQASLSINGHISIKAAQFSQGEYQALLADADLFVMPSRLEGSSPAALEALWMGVPSLLSANCGVDRFSNSRHGILLDPNTASTLASCFTCVLESPSTLDQWSANLIEDRSLFTWDSYLELIPKIVGSR